MRICTGDLYNRENVEYLFKVIDDYLIGTDKSEQLSDIQMKRIDFVCGDGGFETTGNLVSIYFNIQYIRNKNFAPNNC